MATFVTSGALGINLAQTFTPSTDLYPYPGANNFALGTVVLGTDNSQWVYVLASGNIAQYDFVGIDENFAAAPLDETMADDGWQVGVAQVAIDSASYGWVCTKGANVTGKIGASCAADVPLYISATAGTLDDAAGSSTYSKIDGIVAVVGNTATVSANVEVLITWPKSNTF